MAIHTYTCPRCKNLIRVKAEAGRVVEVELCEACALDDALEGEELELLEEEAHHQDKGGASSSRSKKR